MMIVDPPSPFAPASDWVEFLEEMEVLASDDPRNATLALNYAKLARQHLGKLT